MKKCFLFKEPAFVVHTHYMSICFSNTVLILLSHQELDIEFLVLHTKNPPKQLCYCIEEKKRPENSAYSSKSSKKKVSYLF